MHLFYLPMFTVGADKNDIQSEFEQLYMNVYLLFHFCVLFMMPFFDTF